MEFNDVFPAVFNPFPRVLLHRWTPLKMAALVAHRSHKLRTPRFFRGNETVERMLFTGICTLLGWDTRNNFCHRPRDLAPVQIVRENLNFGRETGLFRQRQLLLFATPFFPPFLASFFSVPSVIPCSLCLCASLVSPDCLAYSATTGFFFSFFFFSNYWKMWYDYVRRN